MRQYIGFPLGIGDASVIAAAERLGLAEVATPRPTSFPCGDPSPRHSAETAPLNSLIDERASRQGITRMAAVAIRR